MHTYVCIYTYVYTENTRKSYVERLPWCFTLQRTELPAKCDQEIRQKNAREDDAHFSFLVIECFFLMRCHESTMLLKPRGVVFALYCPLAIFMRGESTRTGGRARGKQGNNVMGAP
jgi:hypothetical protein